MSDKEFINNLSSTYADVRRLDVKKINLKGKNILEYIKESVPIIKHSEDTRETVTENDLWGQWVETLDGGAVIIHDDEVVNPNGSKAWNISITNVEDNKAYVGEDLFANIQIEKIKDGHMMFSRCTNLTTFTTDLNSLTNGYGMFSYCSNLTTFTSDLSSITNGAGMFSGCTNLTTFTTDLSSLTNGYCMFSICSNLTTFTTDLNSITNGAGMFSSCSNLTTFTSDLSSLTNGYSMFSICSNLTTFTTDLSSLTNGDSMFSFCSNLTSFTSDLSSLMYGSLMFNKAKLSPKSVMFIIETIKDIIAEKKLYQDGTIPYVTLADDKYSSTKGFMSDGKYVYTYNDPQPYTTSISASNVGKLTIGINVTDDANTIIDQLQTFAEGAYYDSWDDLKQAFVDKGWTVTWQYGGTSDSITYDLRGGERIIPCPVYVKFIETEDKEKAEYCSEDGTKFYDIDWGHEVYNQEEYEQYDSIIDACVQHSIVLKSMLTEV